MSTAEATPASADSGSSSFFANLIDIYFSPTEAFQKLLRRPSFLAPLMLHIALSLAFSGVWLQKVDMAGFMAARMAESGRGNVSIPADRMESIEKFTKITTWCAGALAPPILLFALGGIFLFVYRFFFASDINYGQSLAVVASTLAAFALLLTPLMLGVLFMKGDWTIAPQEALQANLSMLFDKQTASKPLYALAGSLDIFSFWQMFVLSCGFGVATKRNWSAALPGVLIPWVLVVLIKVGWAFTR